MSDFDKEAERERLREKYEADVEKREATERMSDLLLQGATMTDSHCDNCGDPLFRHDGQEFCPTCQTTDGDAGTAGTDDPATTDVPVEDASAADGDTTAVEADVGVSNADDATATPATDGVEGRSDAERSETDATQPAPETNAAGARGSGQRADASPQRSTRRSPPSRTQTGSENSHDSTRATPATPAGDATDLDTVEASLSRTLLRLTTGAEDETDLARTRDRLAAVREAAAALDAVRDARR